MIDDYRSFPALQSKRCTAEDINDPQEVDELVTAAAVEDTKLDGLINMVLTGWRLYFNHPVRYLPSDHRNRRVG